MNLANIIDGHPADQVALISRNRATTYGALVEQVAGLRGGLAELGVKEGDRVALVVGNGRFFVVSYLAVLGLGAIAVPLNPSSPAPELTRELITVGASTVIIGPAAVSAWRQIDRADVPFIERVIATEGHDLDDASSIDDLITSTPVPVIDVADDHLAVLMFTSGTVKQIWVMNPWGSGGSTEQEYYSVDRFKARLSKRTDQVSAAQMFFS